MVRRLIPRGAPLLVLVAYLGLAVAMFGSTWLKPTTTLIGVGPDPLMFTWFLRWTPYAVMHGINPLFTTFLDFPSGVNLMWNTWVPLIGLVLTPVTVWGGPVLAYNVAATLCPALSAWTAFLMLRRFVTSRAAAAVGGLLYGFSPYMQAQALGHLHLTAAFIPPLLVLALRTILVRQDRSWMWMGGGLGLLAALQLWTSEEMLASEVVVALLAIALVAAMAPHSLAPKRSYVLRAGAVAILVAAALCAYPLAEQFFGPQHVAGPLQPPNVFVSDLFSFVLPTGAQLLAPANLQQLTMRFSGSPAEWGSYLGLPLLALLGLAAWRNWGDAVVRFSARLGVLLVLLSLGLTIHLLGYASAVPAVLLGLPWPAIDHRGPGRVMVYGFIAGWAGLARLPVMSDILPARLMLYVYLLAGVLVAVAIERWLVTGVGRLGRWGGGALIGLSLVTLMPRLPFPSTPASVPAFFLGQVHQTVPAGSVALVAPYADGAHPDAMLWQAASGLAFRMPQGYALIPKTRLDPPPSAMAARMAVIEGGLPAPPLSEKTRQQLLGELSGWKVTWVIVGPMPHHVEMVEFFADLLGQPAQAAGTVDLFRVS